MMSLCGSDMRVILASQNELIYFLDKFMKNWYSFFFRFTSKAICVWDFLCKQFSFLLIESLYLL